MRTVPVVLTGERCSGAFILSSFGVGSQRGSLQFHKRLLIAVCKWPTYVRMPLSKELLKVMMTDTDMKSLYILLVSIAF